MMAADWDSGARALEKPNPGRSLHTPEKASTAEPVSAGRAGLGGGGWGWGGGLQGPRRGAGAGRTAVPNLGSRAPGAAARVPASDAASLEACFLICKMEISASNPADHWL